MYAILIQNAFHPKNSQRVASIKDKTYREIRTNSDAVKYLSDLLKLHMTHELQTIEANVQS